MLIGKHRLRLKKLLRTALGENVKEVCASNNINYCFADSSSIYLSIPYKDQVGGVHIHVDSLNDTLPGFTNVIILKGLIAIDEIENKQFRDYLVGTGFNNIFQLTMVLYSRDCVGRMDNPRGSIADIENKMNIPSYLRLHNRLGESLGHRNQWSNESFLGDRSKYLI